MVDGFFFSRQKVPISSTSLNSIQDDASSASSLTNEITSSVASFQADGSSSPLEAAMKQSSSSSSLMSSGAEEMNQKHLLLESPFATEEFGEESNSRFKRYPNAGFEGASKSIPLVNDLDGFKVLRESELVRLGGGEEEGEKSVSGFINKSSNEIHQNLVANFRGHGGDLVKVGEAAATKTTTSNFHYIEQPDFVVAHPTLVPAPTSHSNPAIPSSLPSKSYFKLGISNKNDSSTLLNNSVNGIRNEGETFFESTTKNRTTHLDDDLSNNLRQQQQQQPSTQFNLNPNSNNNYDGNTESSNQSSNLLSNEAENSRISAAFQDVGQFSSWAPSLGEIFTQNLNSFSDLFSSLLESERQYDEFNDLLTYSMRCRKLTWDYVTELSKLI